MDELVAWIRAEHAELSALVVQIASGRELAAAAPDAALDPASNQKLLTMTTALDQLGADFRFTSLVAGREGPSGLELVLRSDGDPELSSADLGALADALAERGTPRLQGDLLVDQSAFDASYEPPGYEKRPQDSAAYRAPVSAVAVDRNALTLNVSPSDSDGAPAHTWFEPSGIVTSVSGTIATTPAGGAQRVGFSVRTNGPTLHATLSGSVPRESSTLSFSRRLPSPELAAGYALRAKLEQRGLAGPGGVRSGGADISAPFAVHRSRPLSQLIHALGKHSDNFAAEMLFKALGRKASNAPGSSAAGARAVEAYLRRINAWSEGTRVLNGSGLYADNRVSARTLCRSLVAAYQDPRIGSEFVASLAVGGVDGTLANRFPNARGERRIRAKTGTLASVATLSGYVLAREPLGPVAFALLVNGVPGKLTEARRRIDAVVSALTAP